LFEERGTGVERSTKITVMEDGILIAPAPYAAPAAYYFPTVARMQGIEIQKGNSQIKYGPYTTGGAINLLSTQIPEGFAGALNLTAGSFSGRNLHTHIGASSKYFGFLVETSQQSSNGFKQLESGASTGFQRADYIAKFRINTSPDAEYYQSLSLKIGQTTLNANETYLGLTQADFNLTPLKRYAASQMDQISTEQRQYSATHEFKFPKILTITTTVYRTEFSRNWYKLNKVKDSTGSKNSISSVLENPASYEDSYDILNGTTSLLDDGLYVKANNRSYYAQGIQSVLGFEFECGIMSHRIDLGVRYHQDAIDRFQWEDQYKMEDGQMELTQAGVEGTESNRLTKAIAFATYIQYQLRIKKLTITPGLRYENIGITRWDWGKNDPARTGIDWKQKSNQVDIFIPGIGIDYKFSKYISAFVGVHKGFSPPGSTEGTKPEESINYEIGGRFGKNSFRGLAVLFYNDYSNLLGADLEGSGGTGSGDLFNGGEVQSWGIEFMMGYDLLSFDRDSKFSLPFSVTYTFTDAKFLNSFDSDFDPWGSVTSGDKLPYLANNQLTFALSLEHKWFDVNFSGKYMDAMRTQAGRGNLDPSYKTDSYFVIDASAGVRLHKHIRLFMNATNITNQIYVVARRPAGLRPGMPRSFNIGVRANF